MKFIPSFKLYLKQNFPSIIYSILARKNPYLVERDIIIKNLKTDVIIDVGANVGLYAHTVRNLGFDGQIISFEPLSDAFQDLKKISSEDRAWDVYNFALGDENKNSTINISENSVSSSILDSHDKLNELCPEANYSGTEGIQIKRLDTIIEEICPPEARLFVKIDTQGFESKVVRGCLGCLDRIVAFQLEIPLMELYKSELAFTDLINFMDDVGYKLVKIEPGWNDPKTGLSAEIDGIFVKK